MQIHELNEYELNPSSGDWLIVDTGKDTAKVDGARFAYKTDVDVLNKEIAKVITNNNGYRIDTLWEGSMYTGGDSASLTYPVANYDYLDFYTYFLGTSQIYTVEASADSFFIRNNNIADETSSNFLVVGELKLNLSAQAVGLEFNHRWRWSGSSSASATMSSNDSELRIIKIVGRKCVVNQTDTEVKDIRVGADGTVYNSAGEAVRDQVGDLDTRLSRYEAVFTSDVDQSVSNWLDEHPEATTTVEDGSLTTAKYQDGSVTYEKLNDDVKEVFADLNTDILIKDLAGKAISHRGYGWDTVILPNICQNTIPAFQVAVDNGYSGVETDVQKDINGVICCFHDESVDDVTSGTGYLKDLNYSLLYLKNGNGDVTNQKINTLAEVCRWASENDVLLEVEIKTGSNYDEVSIEEVLDVARQFQTKVIINCQWDRNLLAECNENYPKLWKNTNLYYTTEITKELIDSLVEDGHKNLIIYIRNVTPITDAVVKYAYTKGILIMSGINYYSSDSHSAFGMTFSTYGRPNYNSPLVWDSGWIEPETLLNSYSNVSGYSFGYRRIGNNVYLRGLVKNATWEALPTSTATRKQLYSLPTIFRPSKNARSPQNIGDAFSGMHLLSVNATGEVYPCFRVNSVTTVDILNAQNYSLFVSYPANNVTG